MNLARRLFSILISGAPVFGADVEFFEAKIRPALVEHCYKCHSAQSEKLKGGLHVDSREGLLAGGETGPAVVPGDIEKSLLIRALRYKDETLQMPPKQKLPDEVVENFVTWVKGGAPDPRVSQAETAKASAYDFEKARGSWAFAPPKDPPVPAVKHEEWVKTSIDPFILEKLEARKLSPSKPADRRQLLRRVTYDLTGLPPAPEEVESFVNDRSIEAYPRVVERLLNSPRYGERWARHWLDVVRYTDSLDSRGSGSEGDISEAFRYRDWVVQAFNDDLPYTEFIRRQFAGDLLPAPDGGFNTNGVIATGLMAIGEWGTGDADKEKMLTDIVDDQIDVTGRAFLGLTLACARCHDHKFDPIPTEDYYSLAGIFFSSHIVPNPGAKTAGTPVSRIPLAPREEVAFRKARDERVAALDKEIEGLKDAHLAVLATNAIERAAEYIDAARTRTNAPTDLNALILGQWTQFLGFGDIALLSKPVVNVRDKKGLQAWTPPAKDNPSLTVNTTDKLIEFLTIKLPAKTVAVHPSPSDAAVIGWKAPFTGKARVRGKVIDVDNVCGNGFEWRLDCAKQEVAKGAVENGGTQNFERETVEVSAGKFLELMILPKGDYSCDSTAIELEIAEIGGEERRWNLTQEMIGDPHAGNPHADSQGNKVWYFYDGAGQQPPRDLPAESALAKWLEGKGEAAPVQEALRAQLAEPKARDEKSDAAKHAENKLFRTLVNPRGAFWGSVRGDLEILPEPDRERAKTAARELTSLRANPPPQMPVAHGFQEGGVPDSVHAGIKDARIHIRGRYDRLGSAVPRRFPRLLAGDQRPAISNGSGRLELAEWLASPQNPMTARVMVNRIWQHHFGDGIVRTPNNFGKLGIPPTHPELLDHLAHRFIESGWSIKAMHRLIVLSAAYQQSSVPDEKTLAADPGNELFGRMNRRRLEAEALRDSLLAAGARLDLRSGGKSARELTMPRRTLYLTTIRSERSDYRALFDAADASAIVEKRVTSTVAPQALFLLNNPFAVQQVSALTERMLREAPSRESDRIEWLYENLFGREPTQREKSAAARFVDETPESWESFAQVLLASNEFVYID